MEMFPSCTAGAYGLVSVTQEEDEMKLGQLVKDELSDFYGTVYSVTDYASGARRVRVASPETKNGKPVFHFFDEDQLQPLKAKERQGSLFGGSEEEEGPKLPEVEEKTIPRAEFDLLDEVRDPISGFEGKVIAISRYLYGCTRIAVRTDWFNEDGKPVEHEFDETELELVEPAEEPEEEEEKRLHTGGMREDGSGDTRESDPRYNVHNMGLKI